MENIPMKSSNPDSKDFTPDLKDGGLSNLISTLSCLERGGADVADFPVWEALQCLLDVFLTIQSKLNLLKDDPGLGRDFFEPQLGIEIREDHGQVDALGNVPLRQVKLSRERTYVPPDLYEFLQQFVEESIDSLAVFVRFDPKLGKSAFLMLPKWKKQSQRFLERLSESEDSYFSRLQIEAQRKEELALKKEISRQTLIKENLLSRESQGMRRKESRFPYPECSYIVDTMPYRLYPVCPLTCSECEIHLCRSQRERKTSKGILRYDPRAKKILHSCPDKDQRYGKHFSSSST